MRVLKLIFIAVLIAMLSGCAIDDNPTPNNNSVNGDSGRVINDGSRPEPSNNSGLNVRRDVARVDTSEDAKIDLLNRRRGNRGNRNVIRRNNLDNVRRQIINN